MNQNFSGKTEEYQDSNSELLVGPSYCILRNEFLFSNKVEKKSQKDILLLSFGGSDKKNYTLKILEKVVENNLDIQLHIVIGSANLNSEAIKSYCKRTIGNEYFIHHPSNEMAHLISLSDYCIFAGGSSVYEVIYFKKPAMFIATANNQRPNLKWIKENTDYVVLLDSEEFENGFDIGFNNLMEKKSSDCRLVDGKGKYRIVERIKSKLEIK